MPKTPEPFTREETLLDAFMGNGGELPESITQRELQCLLRQGFIAPDEGEWHLTTLGEMELEEAYDRVHPEATRQTGRPFAEIEKDFQRSGETGSWVYGLSPSLNAAQIETMPA